MSLSTPTDARPRVMQLRSSAGLFGADRMVLALNGALPGVGVDSRLASINNYLTPEQALHRSAIARGQACELLPCRSRVDMTTLSRLREQVRGHRIDVLHAHDYKSATYAWLATRRLDVRRVATLHGQVEATRSLRLYNRIERAVLRGFDALAVVAHCQVDGLSAAGIPRDRIQVIDNGIELDDNAHAPSRVLIERFGLQARPFVFGAVARFSPEKNLGQLVEAFARIARAETRCVLLLVGDGPEADALKAQCDALGLHGRVRFTGVMDDMQRVYPLIDCLVLPSLSEGMPLTVLEAMDHALPVIASDVGEVGRLLAASDEGRLVPRQDLHALASAMADRLRAGRATDTTAREYVRSRHSPEAMARRYRDLYLAVKGACDDAHAA